MILKRYQALAKIKSFTSNNPTAANYAIDGILALGAMNLAANNNNLFAQRLGAGDFHLTMLQFLPQMLNLFLLVPAGLFVDSLANKGRMLSAALIAAAVFFLAGAAAGFTAVQPLFFFLAFLALANASLMLYGLSWQGYFPEVVAEGRRNSVLTLRARMGILVSLVIPLISGGVLTSIPSESGKIIAHQFLYGVVAVMLLVNAAHLRKIKAEDPAQPKKIRFVEIKKAGSRLLANKQFKIFAVVALFFHMTWHIDWTLYFIGQANYLRMNEFQIGLAAVGTTAAQLVTLRFWSKRNQRLGPEKPMTFGILGLTLNPIAIIVATSLPIAAGPTVFLIMHTIAMLTFATVGLNIFQCLMPVLDKEYRGFSISVYTCLITLSNAIMPVAGVALYRALGGNINGLRWAFVFVFILRVAAAGLWWYRLKRLVPVKV
ncbi:MAG: hypothetical protein FWC92_10045 [Defluviitaleaceae bacterium]|nr:hypothetical protein [Defluviitaleaceae bacterium]